MDSYVQLSVDLTGFRNRTAPVTLRPVAELTRPALLALVQRCVAGSGDPWLADLDGATALARVAGGPAAAHLDPHFSMVVDDGPVGVTLPWVEDGIGRIALLALVPEARGRGLADRVLAATLERLIALGAQTWVERTHRDNHAALRVLERGGFLRPGPARHSRAVHSASTSPSSPTNATST